MGAAKDPGRWSLGSRFRSAESASVPRAKDPGRCTEPLFWFSSCCPAAMEAGRALVIVVLVCIFCEYDKWPEEYICCPIEACTSGEEVCCGAAYEWRSDGRDPVVVMGDKWVLGGLVEVATMKDFEDGAADPALPKGEVGVEGMVMLESVRFCGEDGEFEQESLHCCSSAAFVKKKKIINNKSKSI